MKAKLLIALVFTLAILGAGFYFFRGFFLPEHRATSTAELVPDVEPQIPVRQVAEQKDSVIPPQIIYITNRFNWGEIESSDYRRYIANLRGVGCPESTIKDIILTDIMKMYAAKRGQFYHNGREFKYWETDEKRKLNARQLDEREKQLASIDKEIPGVLRDLLGINYERELNKYFVDANEEDRRLNFLPEEKRSLILALREKYEGEKERILEAANGKISPADKEALQKIETARGEELAKILSDSERAEFELRMSPTADKLRAELIGFNPSEAEFRQIFEMEKAIETSFALTKPDDQIADGEKAAAQKKMQDELKQQLGAPRYSEYERAQNSDFREARIFAEVHELPVATAQTIFDIKQIAEAERERLLANATLPAAQRLEALRAIQAETEKSLLANLGLKAFTSYSQSTGKWVQQLGPSN